MSTMDLKNFETASVYLNNLLLSRGLLRNGKPIDFAHPFQPIEGPDPTMARIINLVHDMILRRDKEYEERESLAHAIHVLRSTTQQQNVALERLQCQNSELKRSLSLSESQERAFKSTIKSGDAREKSYKDEILRLKAVVQQVRTQCANDVRKRDIQMQKLKVHLNGMQRGRREGFGVTSIIITPSPPPSHGRAVAAAERIDSPDRSLKQETNDFLTGLCQQLSDENDALIGLVRNSLSTLRTLQGLPENPDPLEQSSRESQSAGTDDTTTVVSPPTSSDTLANDMDDVLEHLRTILTNPSFVPIEEVAIREDEIVRLREGWEKMEDRWKEAIAMMDRWRKRMLHGGDTVKLEELTNGLKGTQFHNQDFNTTLRNNNNNNNSNNTEESDAETELSLDDIAEENSDMEEMSEDELRDQEVDWLHLDDSAKKPTSSGAVSQNITVLGESSGNARYFEPKMSCDTIVEEDEIEPRNSNDENDMDYIVEKVRNVSFKAPKSPTRDASPSRLPRPTISPNGLSCSLTVEEKLIRVEQEAKAVQEKKKSKEEQKLNKSPRKSPRKAAKKMRSARRRSTLSPEELEGLMGISC